MSDFFSDLGNAARRVASGVTTEVGVVALEQKVKDAHRILGQLYYQAVAQGQQPFGPEFDAQVENIRRLQQEIQFKRQSYNVNG